MKVLLLLLFCGTALAFEHLPIKVIKKSHGGTGPFECYLEGTISTHNPYGFNRKDEICQNFPAMLKESFWNDLSVEMTGIDNIPALVQFAEEYYSDIKELTWIVHGDYTVAMQNFNDVFKAVSSLEKVELRGWTKQFIGLDKCKVFLERLRSLTFRDTHLSNLELFTLTPRSSRHFIDDLTLDISDITYTPESLEEFFKYQSKITHFNLEGFSLFIAADDFISLELDTLSADFKQNRHFEEQKTFLKGILENNPNLAKLKLGGFLGFNKHIDDSVFDAVCELRKLTVLEFGIDNISMSTVSKISNLRNLEKLVIKTESSGNGMALYEVVMQRMPQVEELFLYFPQHSIEAKTFAKINENYPRLRQLKVYGTEVKVNFFLKTFPNLVVLTVHYGSKTIQKTLADVYEFDGSWHSLEKLSLHFEYDNTIIDTNLLSRMIHHLPSLGTLELKAKLPLDPSFWLPFKKDMQRFSTLILGDFVIPCNEQFDAEKLDGLLKLKATYSDLKLNLVNLIEPISGTDTRDSCFYQENGKLVKRAVGLRDPPVSFEPLFETLKSNFTMHYYEREYKVKTKRLTLLGYKNIV